MLPQTNIGKATAVGVGVGGVSTPLLAYGAQWLEQKYGIPQAISLSVLGSAAGVFMRWAAKLHPAE